MKGDPVSDVLVLKSIMYNEKMKRKSRKGIRTMEENDIADAISDNMGLVCISFLYIFRMD